MDKSPILESWKENLPGIRPPSLSFYLAQKINKSHFESCICGHKNRKRKPINVCPAPLPTTFPTPNLLEAVSLLCSPESKVIKILSHNKLSRRELE
jgi:hypothetical protein